MACPCAFIACLCHVAKYVIDCCHCHGFNGVGGVSGQCADLCRNPGGAGQRLLSQCFEQVKGSQDYMSIPFRGSNVIV